MLRGWTHLTSESFSEAAIFTFQWSLQRGNKENQQNKTKQTLFLHLGLLPGLGFIQKGQSWTTTRKCFGPASQHPSQARTTACWKAHGKEHPKRFPLSRACLRHFSQQVIGERHHSLQLHCCLWDRHHSVIMRKPHASHRSISENVGCSLIFWTFPQPQSV